MHSFLQKSQIIRVLMLIPLVAGEEDVCLSVGRDSYFDVLSGLGVLDCVEEFLVSD
jgi:hypothetical protein